MDFMVSSFRIMSPTSFVYGESVDASNFIQLDDLECHFQPLNVTLQVTTPGNHLGHWDQWKGPWDVSSTEMQLEGQAISRRKSSQPEWGEWSMCVCACFL